jgi:HemY protein
MRFVILLFILIIFATVVGGMAEHNTGAVILYVGDYEVETNLIFMIVLSVLLWSLLFFVLKIFLFLFKLPSYAREQNNKLLHKRAQKNFQAGLLLLIEEKWSKAKKLFVKGLQHGNYPLFRLLSLAKVAQEEGDIKIRDEYLNKAYKISPSSIVAVDLIRAQMHYDKQEYKDSEKILTILWQKNKNHPLIISKLLFAYQKNCQWQKIFDLLPIAKKYKAIDAEFFDEITQQTYVALLQQENIEYKRLEKIWHSFLVPNKNKPIVFKTYIKRLQRFGQDNVAFKEIKTYLSQEWDDDIVLLLGFLKVSVFKEQLNLAKGYLKEHENSPALYLTLGRICIRGKLWGQAKVYLSQSIAILATRAALLEQGRLLEKLEDKDAIKSYKQALSIKNDI